MRYRIKEASVPKKVENIQNIEEYDPSEQSNAQLGDDWRILTQWIAQINDPNVDFETASKEDIFDLGEDIAREIVDRKKEGEINFTVSTEGNSDAYQKMWNEISDRLNEEDVEVLTTKGEELSIEELMDIIKGESEPEKIGKYVDELRDKGHPLVPPYGKYQDLYRTLYPSKDIEEMKESEFWTKIRNAENHIRTEAPLNLDKIKEMKDNTITSDDLPRQDSVDPEIIAVALEDDKETISSSFGRAPYFAIIIEDDISYWDNKYKDDGSQVAWNVIEALSKQSVDRIIAGKFGSNAKRAAQEIDVDLTIKSGSLDDIVKEENELQDKLLEDIDIRDLSNQELVDYHDKLHKWYNNEEYTLDELAKNQALVIDEMRRRDKEFKEVLESADQLDIETRKYISEYPEPWNENEDIHVQEVLKALPPRLGLENKPPKIYLVGGIVNRGYSKKDHDIDIVIKQDEKDPELEKQIRAALPDEISNNLHIVWESEGPFLGWSIPTHELSLTKIDEKPYPKQHEMENNEPDWGDLYSILKPKKTSEYVHRFVGEGGIWPGWAKERMPGVLVQGKYNGIALQVQKKGDDVWILSEKGLERSENLPNVTDALQEALPDEFIGMAEFIRYKDDDLSDPLMRKDFMEIATAEGEQDDENLVAHFWDVLYINGEWINEEPFWKDRWNRLNEIDESSRHIDVMDTFLAEDKEDLAKKIFKISSVPATEGAILKDDDYKYNIAEGDAISRTEDMAKWKNLKELDLIVMDKAEVIREGDPTGVYNYQVGFSVTEDEAENIQNEYIEEIEGDLYCRIGTTYNFDKDVPIGDILTVSPLTVKVEENEKGKEEWTFQFPNVLAWRKEGADVDDYEFMKKMEKLGDEPSFDSWRDLLKEPEELSHELEMEEKFKLPKCPYQDDPTICLLSRKFRVKFGEQELAKYETLKFPIKCRLAQFYHCPYPKDYYYEMMEKKDLLKYEYASPLMKEKAKEEDNDE